MGILCRTSVTATCGREGTLRSDDGHLDIRFAIPTELGGIGGSTNPEQLFAGGYAACFANALLHVAGGFGHRLAAGDVSVVAEIRLSRNKSDTSLFQAKLAITVIGVDQSTAEALVAGAGAICPYSNAIRGNVDVSNTVVAL